MFGDLTGVWGEISGNLVGDLTKVFGDLTGVWGETAGISGNLTKIQGSLDGVWGEISGNLIGDLTGVTSNLSGVYGDLADCELSEVDRAKGVSVAELLLKD